MICANGNRYQPLSLLNVIANVNWTTICLCPSPTQVYAQEQKLVYILKQNLTTT